jgi:cytochrome P450
MGTATDAGRPVKAKRISFYRTVPGLVRDPLRTFENITAQSGGDVVRLDLGLAQPLLVTRPEHVQEVLHEKPTVFSRDGMLWDPLRRLFGNGLASEGATWQPHRRMVQPMFAAKQFTPHIDEMAATIATAVDGLDHYAQTGKPLDVGREMTRIVHRALVRVLFGDKIGSRDADQLTASIEKAFTSLGPRLLLPFVPNSFPLPGDGAFRRAARRVNRVMLPLVRESRVGGQPHGADIVSLISQWRDENGETLDDSQVRDDLILMFVGGSETTAVALTWLFTALGRHPDVAAKLYQEIDAVVGDGPVRQSHLSELTYTRMVIQETLRLYPVGWLIPRTATSADSIGGVRVWRGDTVMLSPYLTHRLPGVWDNPLAFEPERFTAERSAGRHRFAYFPFGGGPHHCVGSHFFTVEAQFIVATLLSRFRPRFADGTATITPQPRATLRPRQRVRMGLRPLPVTVAGRAG